MLHLATGIDADRINRSRSRSCCGGRPRTALNLFLAAPDAFDRNTLDHQISAWCDVAETLLMHLLKALNHDRDI